MDRQKTDAVVTDMMREVELSNDFIEALLSDFTTEQRYALTMESVEILGGMDTEGLIKERRRDVRKRNHLRRKNTKKELIR